MSVRSVEWISDEGPSIIPPQPEHGADAGEAIRGLAQWLTHRVEVAAEVKAVAGPRLGYNPNRTDRKGSDEDVVTPVLLRPIEALSVSSGDNFFDPPPQRLRVDPSWQSWVVTLRTGWFATRKAALRIGSSASGNLTVVQLVPYRPRRFRTSAFVTAGVPAVKELCDRLAD